MVSRRNVTLAVLLGTAIALKVAANLELIASGFRAISDDDFARVVIAQRFADAPSWDPSGTSWLPLPFWVTGVAMLAFGGSLEVARGLAFCLSLGTVLLHYASARFFGLCRPRAAIAAALLGLLPHSLWLGLATVPDGYTAALTLLGIASLSQVDTRARAIGAIALLLASLCRYEVWPVCACFALLTWFEALRGQLPKTALPAAAVALLGMLVWLAHGQAQHGDAFFFVHRVAEYRRALGVSPEMLESLLRYPAIALRAEPELSALFLAALGALGFVAVRARPNASTDSTARSLLQGKYASAVFILGVSLLFLIVGDLKDGAPTHHPERPLLSLWLAAGIFVVDVAASVWARRNIRWLFVSLALPLTLVALLIRPWVTRRDSFYAREDEVAIGVLARNIAGHETRVAVDTEDYGYQAVLAGLGHPRRALVLRSHDPREPQLDLWGNPGEHAWRSAVSDSNWLIADLAHLPELAGRGAIRAQNSKFVLLELARP